MESGIEDRLLTIPSPDHERSQTSSRLELTIPSLVGWLQSRAREFKLILIRFITYFFSPFQHNTTKTRLFTVTTTQIPGFHSDPSEKKIRYGILRLLDLQKQTGTRSDLCRLGQHHLQRCKRDICHRVQSSSVAVRQTC